MKETIQRNLKERQFAVAVLLISLIWSSLLALLAHFRIPLYFEFTDNWIYGNAIPTTFMVFCAYLDRWIWMPLGLAAILALVLVIDQRNSLLRIACATLVVLAILGNVAMTYLAVEGMLSGILLLGRQLEYQEESNIILEGIPKAASGSRTPSG